MVGAVVAVTSLLPTRAQHTLLRRVSSLTPGVLGARPPGKGESPRLTWPPSRAGPGAPGRSSNRDRLDVPSSTLTTTVTGSP